jgi:ribonuclease P/MRP protein subunit POP1
MPLFSSLTHTGTRVGGQRERQTQSFEAGVPYFPRDYPFTAAYEAEVKDSAAEEQERWERKPKAKRCNWEKLNTRSPWSADWEVVLGLKTPEEMEDLVTTQREGDQAPGERIRPWLLRGVETTSIIGSVEGTLSAPMALRTSINSLRVKRDHTPLPREVTPEHLWKGALVRVRVKMCDRGSPGELAMIYQVTNEERKALERKMVENAEETEGRVGYTPIAMFIVSDVSCFSGVERHTSTRLDHRLHHDRELLSRTWCGFLHWCDSLV